MPAGCTEVDVFLVGGGGGSGGSVDQSGDEFYAGSDGSDAPGITDGNGIYHPPGTKYGGGKGQGYTTRDFGEPTGKRNAGGGAADHSKCSLFNNHLTVNTQDLPRYIFYIDSEHEELYSYKDGVLESNVTIMDPVDDYFYNYLEIHD